MSVPPLTRTAVAREPGSRSAPGWASAPSWTPIAPLLLAAACVAVIALPWLVPTASIPRFAGLQSLFGSAGVGVLILGSILLPQALRRARLSWPEALLAAFILLGTVVTLQLPAATGRLWATVWWVEAALVIGVLSRLADPLAADRCLRIYVLVALLASAVFIAARAGLFSGRLPFLIHQNHMALLLLLPTLICVQRLLEGSTRHRFTITAPALLILLAALLLTQSRAAWVGAAFGMAVIGVVSIRRWLQPGLSGCVRLALWIVAGAALVLVADRAWVALGHDSLLAVMETFRHLDEGSIGGRLRRWDNALLLIRDHWLSGVGLGNWAVVYDNYRHVAAADSGGSVSALSTYVLILAETGLLGLLLFVGFAAAALVGAARRGAPLGIVAAAWAWLAALAFHSAYDFKLPLLGFAFTMGLLIRPAVTADAPTTTRRTGGVLALLLLGAGTLVLADARYGIAELERLAVTETAVEAADDRRLWRWLDPLSTVIDPPMSAADLITRPGDLVAANRYQLPGEDDFLLVLAGLSQQRGDLDAALQWIDQALARNPDSAPALTRACRLSEAAGRQAAAREFCQKALDANPAQPDVHRMLARLDLAQDQPRTALARLQTARSLLDERLGKNNFGTQTRDLVGRQYASLRTVSDNLLALHEAHPPGSAERLTEIARTASVHKRVTSIGCHLYFSANLNERYNLWRLNLCAGTAASPSLMSNDSLAPFRLRTDGRHVYFMADNRGDNQFELYRFDPRSGSTVEVERPRGVLLEYSPAPDGRQVALVVHRQGSFRLYVGEPDAGSYRQVLTSRHPFSEPHWYPPAVMPDAFLVIEAGRRLHRVAGRTGTTEVVLEDPLAALTAVAASPGGSTIAYTRRTGARESSLHLLDPDGGSRTLLTGTDSVIADPLWRDVDRLAFREVVDDEYLLREMTLEDASVRTLGPATGVVYDVHASEHGLLFAAADPVTPASLYQIPQGSRQARQVLRFDWVPGASVVAHQRRLIDAEHDVVAYRYPARSPDHGAAVLWLHGGSNRFSPRWHPYAQYFATAGFEFLALNYREPWPLRGADREAQADDVAQRVEALRREGFTRIFLVGVSTGTQIIQTYIRSNRPDVDGVVEYSPVNNDDWERLRDLPPLLAFTGVNDPLLDHTARLDAIDEHRRSGGAIGWIAYPDEGHDLRGRRVIEDRLVRTRLFLEGLTVAGSAGAQALVAEVPRLDQDSLAGRRVHSAGVIAE